MKLTQENYLKEIQKTFRNERNSLTARQMKQYMRNKFEFAGLKSPLRRSLQKDFLQKYSIPDINSMFKIVERLWELPEREFQYFALEMLYKRIKKVDREAIEYFEDLIVKKSWWDTVDYLAASHVGIHFMRFPDLIPSYTSRWMDSGNIWLQRSCLLFQLKYKESTDLELLYTFINKLKDSDEFFIRKAIGWVLREYSKTDPEEVLRYVNQNALKSLSRSEALKIINREAERQINKKDS